MTSAPITEQRLLIDLQQLDSQLARLGHERAHLPALSHIEHTIKRLKDNKRAAVLAAAALTDARAEATRAETEVDQVVRRAQTLRERLSAGTAAARDLSAIQGEIDQLGRRQAVLEDKQISAIESVESAQAQVDELAAQEQEIRAAGRELTAVRDTEFARIDAETAALRARRDELVARISPALLEEYEAVRARTGGLGAVALHDRRLEGAAIEISPAEHARIAAAPADAIIHAEENDVIIVRMDI
ncbi:zinc ribbon domain-containing protein [Actinomyces howellii]|uniref:CT398-like coiled coil hairpin domain-containing protein n=1 Tax=Actinomyces howellii TaxID=52771 RepID=A0A448HDG6_9ACTO|nr:hypothetical protein [Actinomyces howellii]VEG25800.1 Uncharacterised protein [Actinomyces howellii]